MFHYHFCPFFFLFTFTSSAIIHAKTITAARRRRLPPPPTTTAARRRHLYSLQFPLLFPANKTLTPSHPQTPLFSDMSPSSGGFSDSDDDFSEDMEALKRACQLTRKSPVDHQLRLSSISAAAVTNGDEDALSEAESDGEDEEDLELVQYIKKRFAAPINMENGLIWI